MDCEIRVSITKDNGFAGLEKLGIDPSSIAVEHMIEQLQEEAKQHTCDEHECGPVFLNAGEVVDDSFSIFFDVCCDRLGQEFKDSVYEEEEDRSESESVAAHGETDEQL